MINGANQTIAGRCTPLSMELQRLSWILFSDAAYVAGIPEADPDSATKLLKIVWVKDLLLQVGKMN